MRYPVLLFATFALTSACGGAPEATEEAPIAAEEAAEPGLPDRIVAQRGGFVPEGIEYDPASGRLLTGSISEGTIYHIGPDGSVTPAVTDPDLVSSVGIEVDSDRNRLLVANADAGAFDGSSQGQAKLGVYELGTGERLAMVDLGASIPNRPADASHFGNDVAVADDGTVYITDTMQNIIYEVGEDYQASVLYRFESDPDLGINGIEYHPSGYLLVAGGATLYKVTLGDTPAASPVTLSEPVTGQDGLVWTQDGELVITSNSESRVVALTSNDDWASAEVTGTASFEGQGTTAAVVGDAIYVVQPHFSDADPPVILRANLP